MILDGVEAPNYLIKVSKREYQEAITKGYLYFNDIEYFRSLETDCNSLVADIREGKTKLNFASTIDVLPGEITYRLMGILFLNYFDQ